MKVILPLVPSPRVRDAAVPTIFCVGSTFRENIPMDHKATSSVSSRGLLLASSSGPCPISVPRLNPGSFGSPPSVPRHDLVLSESIRCAARILEAMKLWLTPIPAARANVHTASNCARTVFRTVPILLDDAVSPTLRAWTLPVHRADEFVLCERADFFARLARAHIDDWDLHRM